MNKNNNKLFFKHKISYPKSYYSSRKRAGSLKDVHQSKVFEGFKITFGL